MSHRILAERGDVQSPLPNMEQDAARGVLQPMTPQASGRLDEGREGIDQLGWGVGEAYVGVIGSALNTGT